MTTSTAALGPSARMTHQTPARGGNKSGSDKLDLKYDSITLLWYAGDLRWTLR